MSTKQKTYSNEFKEEAVKRVMSGIPASQVARELDINVNSLYTEAAVHEASRAAFCRQRETP